MEGVDRVSYDSAFGYEEGGLAVYASAAGEDGVFEGVAGVGWDDGVKTKGWE